MTNHRQYLMIENPGVAPVEAFTLLGASTTRDAGSDYIGKFGTGNKHGLTVSLRHNISPTIFCDKLKMVFSTKPTTIEDGISSSDFESIYVKFSGSQNGKTKNNTEKLGFVKEYGASNWMTVGFALREFISNAIDHSMKFNRHHNKDVRYPWDGVKVEIVDAKSVRAKSGKTRVFIPLTLDVYSFYNNINKWFLHFDEPELVNAKVLDKNGRNIVPDNQGTVVFRRGVRVHEINDKSASAFDYNLNDLELDESRQVHSYYVKGAASKALVDASETQLIRFLDSIGKREVWEFGLDLNEATRFFDSDQKTFWGTAFSKLFGPDSVVIDDRDENGIAILERKGKTVIKVPNNLAQAADKLGMVTKFDVLSADECQGLTIHDASSELIQLFDYWWNILIGFNMTAGKNKPELYTFTSIMDGETDKFGFWRGAGIYLNSRLSGLCDKSYETTLHEIGHYVTGSTDNSRDFQEFFIRLAVQMAKAQNGKEDQE